MMAFFFTMPINRTIPMSAMTRQFGVKCQQSQKRSHAGRGQSRENRHRVDVTFVQHPQHNVDSDQRGQNEPRLARQRRLEGLRVPLERRMNIGRKSHSQNRRFDIRHGVAQSDSFSKIERDRDRGKLALVVYGEGRILRLIVGKSAQGHLGSSSTIAHRGLGWRPCCPGRSNRLPCTT